MMAHSDVMVTVYSTMLVETAVHDTPSDRSRDRYTWRLGFSRFARRAMVNRRSIRWP